MSNIRNRVQLIGHLGDDPVITKFDSGKVKAAFSMATTEKYKNSEGELIEDTQWHNIVMWGGMVETAEKYFKKGKEIAVLGRLTHRTFDDKEGNKKYFTEVNVNNFEMFGKKQD